MKLTEIDPGKWNEIRPYVDTALIPVFPAFKYQDLGVMLNQHRQLNAVSVLLERKLTGRLLLFPTHFYPVEQKRLIEELRKLIAFLGLKHHLFLFYAKFHLDCDAGDNVLFVTDQEDDAAGLPQEALEALTDRLVSQLVRVWSA
jgi:hypothetical protein